MLLCERELVAIKESKVNALLTHDSYNLSTGPIETATDIIYQDTYDIHHLLTTCTLVASGGFLYQ